MKWRQPTVYKQEHFTVIWSTLGMCSDHWSSNFPGAASPPPCCSPCWVAAACFTPDLSTHQSTDHVLLLQGSVWGPLGMTAVVVEVMIIMVIIINKTQALLSILHGSQPCRQPTRQAQPVCTGPSNTCCGLGCVSGGFSAATPQCDALQGINLAWFWKVWAAHVLGSAGAHHLTELGIYPTERGEESCSGLGKDVYLQGEYLWIGRKCSCWGIRLEIKIKCPDIWAVALRV